jgi:hypothetical protein
MSQTTPQVAPIRKGIIVEKINPIASGFPCRQVPLRRGLTATSHKNLDQGGGVIEPPTCQNRFHFRLLRPCGNDNRDRRQTVAHGNDWRNLSNKAVPRSS